MKRGIEAEDDQAPELAIPLKTVCFIIMKARQFDAKETATEPDPGSNPTDDENAAILQDQADDPVQEELTSLISDLSDDEQIDLVTLMWLGRGDYGPGDWPSVRAQLSTPTMSTRPSISPASRCSRTIWPRVLTLSACPVPTLRAGVCKRRSACESVPGFDAHQ